MTVAVHITTSETPEKTDNFTFNCFTILAGKYPEYHFIFIFDRPYSPSLIKATNVTPVLVTPQIRNRLLQHYFYNFKIPVILNKYQVDFFICTSVCSLRTKVPQCIIIPDLAFLKKNNSYTRNDARYLKRYTKYYLKKANRIIVHNYNLKSVIEAAFKVEGRKISIVKLGIDKAFQSFSPENCKATIDRVTDGKAYFLYFATSNCAANIIIMLKAFSIFKKWQKSNMQLVILSSPTTKISIPGFSNYKYHHDVKILTAESKDLLVEIIGAAYAAIYLPETDITEYEGLQTISSEVPLICINNDFQKSIFKEFALYASANEKDISEKMMLVYKDEKKRNEMITEGKKMTTDYTWDSAANELWETLRVPEFD